MAETFGADRQRALEGAKNDLMNALSAETQATERLTEALRLVRIRADAVSRAEAALAARTEDPEALVKSFVEGLNGAFARWWT